MKILNRKQHRNSIKLYNYFICYKEEAKGMQAKISMKCNRYGLKNHKDKFLIQMSWDNFNIALILYLKIVDYNNCKHFKGETM